MAMVIPWVKAAFVAVKAWAATTAFTVVGTAVTYGTLVKAAIVVGTYAYNRKQAKKALGAMNSLMAAEVRTQNIRTSTGPALIVVGKVRVGGYVPFTTQSGTNKEYTHLLVVHSWLECDSFVKHYLNNEEITLDGSGNVTAPAKWAGLVRVKTHLGSPTQTVDTDLQTDVGSSLWSNDHRLRGFCYSYVRYKTDSDSFAEGLPVYTVDLKGVKWYDPRTATTVWTANPSPIIRGWLLLSKDMGGYGAAASAIIDAEWNTVANSCDEAVSLAAGGTENRYELNGIIDTAVARGQILDELCGGMAGSCPWYNGAFHPIAGVYGSVVMDLTDDDAVGALDVETRDSSADAFNGVRGIYNGEKNQWQGGDFPEVKNDTYMAEDGGERLWKDIVLNFTTSPSMCQRLAKIMLEESRQDFAEVFPGKLKCLELVPGSLVTRTTAAMGWTAKPFRVKACGVTQTQDEKGNPLIVPGVALRETAAGVYDWNSGEETAVDLAPNSTLYDANTVPTPATPTLSTDNFKQPDGTIAPRLKVVIAAPADIKVTVGGRRHLEYKKSADSTWIPWTSCPGNITEDYITDVLSGVSYDVRAQYENRFTKRGLYSTTATATPGADTTAPATPATPTLTSTTGSNTLNWTDNTETDLAGYEVWRHTSNASGSASKVAFVKANRWIDTLATAATTYYYWLKAVDTSGNASGFSSVASGVAGAGGGALGSGSGTAVNIPSTSYVDLASIAVTTDGGVRIIIASVAILNADASSRIHVFQLYRDSTPIGNALQRTVGAGLTDSITIATSDNPSAGSYTYYIKGKLTTSPGDSDCDSTIIVN